MNFGGIIAGGIAGGGEVIQRQAIEQQQDTNRVAAEGRAHQRAIDMDDIKNRNDIQRAQAVEQMKRTSERQQREETAAEIDKRSGAVIDTAANTRNRSTFAETGPNLEVADMDAAQKSARGLTPSARDVEVARSKALRQMLAERNPEAAAQLDSADRRQAQAADEAGKTRLYQEARDDKRNAAQLTAAELRADSAERIAEMRAEARNKVSSPERLTTIVNSANGVVKAIRENPSKDKAADKREVDEWLSLANSARDKLKGVVSERGDQSAEPRPAPTPRPSGKMTEPSSTQGARPTSALSAWQQYQASKNGK